jgi:hypothetical protein
MTKIKLSVIIVVYNHQQFLANCLSSLRISTAAFKPKVIVIDNCSTDGSVNFLKSNFKDFIRLIQNPKNYGFAKACNQGIQKAQGDYLLFLNPDTQITGQAIEKMILFLDHHPLVACLVPCLLNPDQTPQFSLRNFPGIITVLAKRTPLKFLPYFKKARDFHLEKNFPSQPQAINWALGSCFLIRKKVFEKIGYFDEHFFVYCEDIDFFYRLKKAGLKTYFLPEAKVIHYHQAKSDKVLFSKESFYHFKSILYFFKKYFWEILTNKYPGK